MALSMVLVEIHVSCVHQLRQEAECRSSVVKSYLQEGVVEILDGKARIQETSVDVCWCTLLAAFNSPLHSETRRVWLSSLSDELWSVFLL
ncbi:unnamed protein product [Mesocestoides corti]|uniref:Uncharacterized protein n=2 Tax=Mesocestoides corti TaxID=53468 RepID=A0A0R3URM5_MESCO|nr:unnamed protein product [Mesocestoides corti]